MGGGGGGVGQAKKIVGRVLGEHIPVGRPAPFATSYNIGWAKGQKNEQ